MTFNATDSAVSIEAFWQAYWQTVLFRLAGICVRLERMMQMCLIHLMSCFLLMGYIFLWHSRDC